VVVVVVVLVVLVVLVVVVVWWCGAVECAKNTHKLPLVFRCVLRFAPLHLLVMTKHQRPPLGFSFCC